MSGGPPPASRFEAEISSGSCAGHCRGHAGSVSLQEREAVIDRQSSAPEPDGGRPGAGRRRARDGGATAALAMTGGALPVEKGAGAGAGAGSDRHSSGRLPRPLAQAPAVPRAESRPCPAQKRIPFIPDTSSGGSSPYRAPEHSLPRGGGGGRAAIAAAACGCGGAAGGWLTAAACACACGGGGSDARRRCGGLRAPPGGASGGRGAAAATPKPPAKKIKSGGGSD